MKTVNYGIDLMLPMQNNKEIIFNESINKIDTCCNISVVDFVDSPPQDISDGQKYIINNLQDQNKICYVSTGSKNWQLLEPYNMMVIYVVNRKSFYVFEDHKWQVISSNSNSQTSSSTNEMPTNLKFQSIENMYNIPGGCEYFYLYINNNCQLNLSTLDQYCFTIIIKQNYQKSFKITWSDNILWKNQTTHQITGTLNSIDMVRFYRLPEIDYYMGEIIGQNYKF